ncbi:ActS/PrrB/RegB family redox-sensitive histidine kinase [Hyphococcus flavus]|uniref:histidine kinase n=1 Tax=Hyphococcus flavus TaxID=1866326 RepID=A0AAE9ZL24_9PROT|nr:ActS/PrrB/RegB family redox-sensitive histidine kinase [Hyphococcus flavus]WDI33111.1 ActS/PrrB/RegB family redox-sensitive histidine kinase [Hyphococcus flavus]
MPHALADPQAAMNALKGPVRLRTLTTLRWLAVAGQTVCIVVVHFALGFPTPLGLCLGAIAASAWLNLFVTLRYSPQRFLTDREAAGYIAFDIVQLCLLLFFTGGLQNPFSALIIAPVTIAASVLPLRFTIGLAALAIAGVSILALNHMPIPWRPGESLELAPVYKAGFWAALTFSISFFAAYAHRIAAESAQMRSALAATQLVLAREERLAALGGLAAAAAHELGTPLATIQVTAKEMLRDIKRELEDHEDLADDAALLVSQAERCRDILSRLSHHGDAGDAMHDKLAIDDLLREAAAPFLDQPGGPTVRIEARGLDDTKKPVLKRRPEIIFGLRNFIENAAGFALSTVLVRAEWNDAQLAVSIQDDGPGFSPEILTRLGEPYVSARTGHRGVSAKSGLGLGFFIAKTLLEASGARIDFENREWEGETGNFSGAHVGATWDIKASNTSIIA